MCTSSRLDSAVEMQHSLVHPPHADSLLIHWSEGSEIPTNSSSTPITNQPTSLFFESEPTQVGRRWKCRDMSGLSQCLCSDSARPDDTGSIWCQRARCETVWVSITAYSFRILIDNHTVPPSMHWVQGHMAKVMDLWGLCIDKEVPAAIATAKVILSILFYKVWCIY